MADLLSIMNLSKHFDGVTALDNFSLSLDYGSIVGIIGPNGAGKTTMFNVISGFLSPENGEIRYRDINLSGMPDHRIAGTGISRTFQDLRLIMKLSVLENVMLAMKNQKGENIFHVLFNPGGVKKAEAENRDKAVSLLEYVALQEKINDPAENLSYGQQKLLSLACCLATDAELLLLDEPVAGIHPEIIEKILNIIKELKEKDKTVVMIEHNLDAVARISDRIVVMDEGRKVVEGKHDVIINDPRVLEAYLE